MFQNTLMKLCRPSNYSIMAVPDSMRAVQLRAYDGKPESIAVVEMRVPRPGPGEVLVRVFASPIKSIRLDVHSRALRLQEASPGGTRI
jgi:hypothetical protein